MPAEGTEVVGCGGNENGTEKDSRRHTDLGDREDGTAEDMKEWGM
jgi:hypothetical protein